MHVEIEKKITSQNKNVSKICNFVNFEDFALFFFIWFSKFLHFNFYSARISQKFEFCMKLSHKSSTSCVRVSRVATWSVTKRMMWYRYFELPVKSLPAPPVRVYYISQHIISLFLIIFKLHLNLAGMQAYGSLNFIRKKI